MLKQIKTKKAFTLIELLVVISVIGLISSIALVSLNGARAKARDAKRMSDLKVISDAIERYNIDNGEYPLGALYATPTYEESDCGIKDGVLEYSVIDNTSFPLCSGSKLKKGTSIYLDSIPEDPSPENTQYEYAYGGVIEATGAPCLTAYLEELNSGRNVVFFCHLGSCMKDGTSGFQEWHRICGI